MSDFNWNYLTVCMSTKWHPDQTCLSRCSTLFLSLFLAVLVYHGIKVIQIQFSVVFSPSRIRTLNSSAFLPANNYLQTRKNVSLVFIIHSTCCLLTSVRITGRNKSSNENRETSVMIHVVGETFISTLFLNTCWFPLEKLANVLTKYSHSCKRAKIRKKNLNGLHDYYITKPFDSPVDRLQEFISQAHLLREQIYLNILSCLGIILKRPPTNSLTVVCSTGNKSMFCDSKELMWLMIGAG